MAVYGVWAVRRDHLRGRASARGFGFDKATQPVLYRMLMTFNGVAVVLLVIVTLFLIAQAIRPQLGSR